MEANLSVMDALEQFISSGNAWMCRTVVSAHPAVAFEEIAGEVPALWLSADGRFPGLWKDLMARLTETERGAAVETLSKRFAMKSLDSISVCMQYQTLWPERSQARKLRREIKLAKKISKLLMAASSAEAGQSKSASSVFEFSQRAKIGVASALLNFRRANPASGIWVSALCWEDVGDAAVARAESKSMGKACGLAPAPIRAAPRL
jgi:hypothetical protein